MNRSGHAERRRVGMNDASRERLLLCNRLQRRDGDGDERDKREKSHQFMPSG
jgi:hypothetical protein